MKRNLRKHPFSFASQLASQCLRVDRSAERDNDVTTKFILELADTQNNLCAISGHDIYFRANTSWTASLDRLDDNIGHVRTNVRLVAQRFNTRAKWTREKYDDVSNLILQKIDLVALETQIEQARHSNRVKAKTNGHGQKLRRTKGKSNLWSCSICGYDKPLDQFYICRNGIPKSDCKECVKLNAYLKRRTLRGFVQHLLDGCQSTTKLRNARGRNLEFNITLDYVLNLLWNQRGRCSISGIPMSLKPSMDWKMSIERLNNSIGYVIGNVSLVCWEFQSSDFTVNAHDPSQIEGSCQWDRSTFFEAWPHLASS